MRSQLFNDFAFEDRLVFKLNEQSPKGLLNRLDRLRPKKVVLLPGEKLKGYPYLYFLIFLKKRMTIKGFKVEGLFFLFPSFEDATLLFPSERKISYFVETRFYQRLLSPSKFFLKKLFLKIFGPIFLKYPMVIVLS